MRVRNHCFYRGPKCSNFVYTTTTPPSDDRYYCLAARELQRDDQDAPYVVYAYLRRSVPSRDGVEPAPLLPNSVKCCWSSIRDPHATQFPASDPIGSVTWDHKYLQKGHERALLYMRGEDWECCGVLENENDDTPREVEMRVQIEKLTNELEGQRKSNQMLIEKLRLQRRWPWPIPAIRFWWRGNGPGTKTFKPLIIKRFWANKIRNPILRRFKGR